MVAVMLLVELAVNELATTLVLPNTTLPTLRVATPAAISAALNCSSATKVAPEYRRKMLLVVAPVSVKETLKVGALTLVRLSVEESPASLAATKSGTPGGGGPTNKTPVLALNCNPRTLPLEAERMTACGLASVVDVKKYKVLARLEVAPGTTHASSVAATPEEALPAETTPSQFLTLPGRRIASPSERSVMVS
jgi:hypothetical protein